MLWLSPTRGTLRLTKIASDFSSFYVHRTPWAAGSCHSSTACSLQTKWTEMHSLTCWLSGPYLKSAVITAFVTAGSSVEPILPSQWSALGCVQAAGLQLLAGRCPELCPVAMFAAEMPSLEGWGANCVPSACKDSSQPQRDGAVGATYAISSLLLPLGAIPMRGLQLLLICLVRKLPRGKRMECCVTACSDSQWSWYVIIFWASKQSSCVFA